MAVLQKGGKRKHRKSKHAVESGQERASGGDGETSLTRKYEGQNQRPTVALMRQERDRVRGRRKVGRTA